MKSDEYISTARDTIQEAWTSQREVIQRTAECISQTVTEGGSVYVFGCSHAGILAEEAFYRSGGLAVVNPIFFPALMLNTRPVTMTSMVERVAGIGRILAEENKLKKGDLLLIHSVSGRNTVSVELAEEASRRGVTTVAMTNLAYSKAVSSRAPSGKRLFEVCDIVIDNCGSVGDAVVSLPGMTERIGPTSTVCGTALLNGIIIEATERILEANVLAPVFMSANLDGGDAHNKAVLEKYQNQIHYM